MVLFSLILLLMNSANKPLHIFCRSAQTYLFPGGKIIFEEGERFFKKYAPLIFNKQIYALDQAKFKYEKYKVLKHRFKKLNQYFFSK